MNFNATYSGKVYAMTGGTIYEYSGGYFAGTTGYANVSDDAYANTPRVALTGYSVTSKRGSVGWQTTNGGYIILSEGWQQVGTVAIGKYSQTQAQKLVDKIIKNNITIVQNNLVCARFASKFTAEQQQMIRELQNRCESRKNALAGQGLCSNVKTSYPKGYADLGGYLDALMNGEAIGIATWAVVVIAAVIIAATATAAYFAYKAFAEESERDVKYSQELTKILMEKLTPEEYEQLLQETQGIVTKARLKAGLRGGWSVLTIAAVAVAGLAAYKVFKNYF